MTTALDLVNSISAGKAGDVEDVFNTLVAQKTVSAVNQVRSEISSEIRIDGEVDIDDDE